LAGFTIMVLFGPVLTTRLAAFSWSTGPTFLFFVDRIQTTDRTDVTDKKNSKSSA
jgi:hypothetical protein